MKIIKKTKGEIVFETKVRKVAGNYLGVYFPKTLSKDFSEFNWGNKVRVTLKRIKKKRKRK